MSSSDFIKNAICLFLCSLFLIPSILINAQTQNPFHSEYISLNYISPSELIEALAITRGETGCYQVFSDSGSVQLYLNQATNQILLSGDKNHIEKLIEFIKIFDVPPRQIVIEARIVEIDNQKSREIGLDWQTLLDQYTFPRIDVNWDLNKEKRNNDRYSTDRKSIRTSSSSNLRIGDFLKLVQESGAGKILNVPHIVTTNNKTGTIFDGQKIKYVAQLSSYGNIYETQELSAGLMLSVTPSLGQSGILKLDVNAKLTTLIDPRIPTESGQILENTVIVKDGESIVLGGFKRTEKFKVKRRTPIIGYILPFLFSRDIYVESTRDVLIILSPKIIDLNIPEVPEIK